MSIQKSNGWGCGCRSFRTESRSIHKIGRVWWKRSKPLCACPASAGFGRTIASDLNKAIPDRSLAIKDGVVRVFRGAEFGESQKDLLRACAREEIDINIPFEELPKSDQDFVIKGQKRSGDYTEDDYENDR